MRFSFYTCKKSYNVFNGQINWHLEDIKAFFVGRGRYKRNEEWKKRKSMERMKRGKRNKGKGDILT